MFSDVLNVLFENAIHFIKLSNLCTAVKVNLFCRIGHTAKKKNEIDKMNTDELGLFFYLISVFMSW